MYYFVCDATIFDMNLVTGTWSSQLITAKLQQQFKVDQYCLVSLITFTSLSYCSLKATECFYYYTSLSKKYNLVYVLECLSNNVILV
jgi:hypothetical protein